MFHLRNSHKSKALALAISMIATERGSVHYRERGRLAQRAGQLAAELLGQAVDMPMAAPFLDEGLAVTSRQIILTGPRQQALVGRYAAVKTWARLAALAGSKQGPNDLLDLSNGENGPPAASWTLDLPNPVITFQITEPNPTRYRLPRATLSSALRVPRLSEQAREAGAGLERLLDEELPAVMERILELFDHLYEVIEQFDSCKTTTDLERIFPQSADLFAGTPDAGTPDIPLLLRDLDGGAQKRSTTGAQS